MAVWLGLDAGTTSSKAVVFDDTGRPLGEGRHPTRWDITADGVQIDPQALLDGAASAMSRALQHLPENTRVAGLGVTSMGETGVLVDRHGRPVAPAIAWHDTRDAAEVDRLERELGADRFSATIGKPVRGQWSLTKHRWLVDHQPGSWSLLGGTEGGLAMQRALSVLGVSREGLAALDQLALQAPSDGVRVGGIGGSALEIGGLTDGVGPGHVWRAVVEAATAQAVALHRAMIDIVGPHRHLVTAGGWCNSDMVMAAKLAGFGKLTRSRVAEAGALGAATLAAWAAGHLDRSGVLRSVGNVGPATLPVPVEGR